MNKYSERDKHIIEIFPEVVASVSDYNEVDMGVAVAMIASVCNVRTGRVEAEEGYAEYKGVPEYFDCELFLAEYGEA